MPRLHQVEANADNNHRLLLNEDVDVLLLVSEHANHLEQLDHKIHYHLIKHQGVDLRVRSEGVQGVQQEGQQAFDLLDVGKGRVVFFGLGVEHVSQVEGDDLEGFALDQIELIVEFLDTSQAQQVLASLHIVQREAERLQEDS